jgi:hypothetical protein
MSNILPENSKNIWSCKIGGISNLPVAADSPMREAICTAYKNLTGEEPKFIFSGWDAELTEPERAIVENRPIHEDYESIESQIARLANFIMKEFPKDIQGEGAVDTAIKILTYHKDYLND